MRSHPGLFCLFLRVRVRLHAWLYGDSSNPPPATSTPQPKPYSNKRFYSQGRGAYPYWPHNRMQRRTKGKHRGNVPITPPSTLGPSQAKNDVVMNIWAIVNQSIPPLLTPFSHLLQRDRRILTACPRHGLPVPLQTRLGGSAALIPVLDGLVDGLYYSCVSEELCWICPILWTPFLMDLPSLTSNTAFSKASWP